MTTKYTQKQLRSMIDVGIAIDATCFNEMPHPYTKVGYSCGIYGINGALLVDDVTGDLYVIKSRCTALAKFC